MAKRIYKARKMTQSTAVVKLRTYVGTSKYSAGIVSKCNPSESSDYTIYSLRIGDGKGAFSIISRESFDDAFYKLDQTLEQMGLVKGEL